MDPASRLLATVLPALLARAPLTAHKVDFARATRVQLLDSGTLLVHVENPSWRREVEGAFPVILPRLTPLLGAGALRRLTIASEQE